MAELKGSTPVFRMFDEGKAREFYLGYLDFSIVFEHRFEPTLPLYLGLKRDQVTLHLSEHHGDASPGAAIRIEVDDIEGLHAQLKAKDYSYQNPGIQDQPWGSREVSVTDPFGNRIVFFQTTE